MSDHPLFGSVISTYSRKQAIADGSLIDVSAQATEAGFRHPMALTASVMADVKAGLENPSSAGQSVEGRVWDVVWMASRAVKNARPGTRLNFSVIIGRTTHQYILHIGPGDTPDAVLTVMSPQDD